MENENLRLISKIKGTTVIQKYLLKSRILFFKTTLPENGNNSNDNCHTTSNPIHVSIAYRPM